MKELKFSIIVPVYNTKENYLRESLDALKSLNYNNYEVIIVDDGSNETTKCILKEYESNITKIYHQENSGQHIARINGITKAESDYIIFVDSDDIYGKDNLSILNEIINNTNVDMVIYDAVRFNEKESSIPLEKTFDKEGIIEKDKVIKKIISLKAGSMCLKCIKKQIIETSTQNIDARIRKGEDLVQSADVILNSRKFYYTNRIIYRYRINEEYREYYSFDRIDQINYLVTMYNKFFVERTNYKVLLPIFKLHIMNEVVSNAFEICKVETKNENRKKYLDILSKQEIVSIINSIPIRVMFVNEFLFWLVKNKCYPLIFSSAFIFNKMRKY